MKLQLVKSDTPLDRTGDVPQQLRKIAEDIETGALVGVISAAVIVKSIGAQLDIYGLRDGDPIARLNAAHVLLSLALRELERVAVAADN